MNISTEDPATYVERRIGRKGCYLYVREYLGEGPVFVLMHGFPDNLRIYDRLGLILAAGGRHVVSFDFLGYGQSDKPNDYPHTAKSMEGDLDTVIEALGLNKVIPVGHDASGPTAINWSLDHQDRVAVVALMNVYYDFSPTLRFPELISLFADPAYRDLSTAIISEPEQFMWLANFQAHQFLREAPPEIQGLARKELVPIVRDQFTTASSAGPAFVALTRDLNNSLEENAKRMSELSKFDAPVKLIWGASDPYLNIGVAQHLKGHFANAQVIALRAGHWPQLDVPKEVAESLLALTAGEHC